MKRCNWPGMENSDIYKSYHDNEWGVANYDSRHLFEMFVLESFHCGLSWLIILKKRSAFKAAFNNFDANIIANYTEEKIEQLMQNTDIVRNRAKILATVQNAKSCLQVCNEFGSFSNYIWSFTGGKTVKFAHDGTITKNELSDAFAKDVKKRGFKFMGSVTAFSYLEAVGVMNNHAEYCFRHSGS